MRRMLTAALLGLAAGAMPLSAQGPGGPGGPGGHGMMMMGPPMEAASFLLAHTGELKLSDAQVTRLAGLARQSHDRMEALHNSMMQQHQQMMAQHAQGQQGQAPDFAAMQAHMKQAHDQMHADLRDALAVLTPDQQATAFELVAHHGGPGGPHGEGHGPEHMRHPGGPGRGGPDGQGGPGGPPPHPES